MNDTENNGPVAIGAVAEMHEIIELAKRAQAAQRENRPAREEDDLTLAMQRREQAKDQRLRNALRRGVPESDKILAMLGLHEPWDTEAMRMVRGGLAWRGKAKGRALLLALCGLPGTGKSAALYRAVAEHERSALLVWAGDVMGTPRNGFSENETYWKQLNTVDLLAIDELGRSLKTELDHVILDLCIRRWDHGLVTLISTNLNKPAYVARFTDGALVDRAMQEYSQQVHEGAPERMISEILGKSLRGGNA